MGLAPHFFRGGLNLLGGLNTAGGPGPPLFLGGPWGALIYAILSAMIRVAISCFEK